jgi:hypothetical protein
MKAYRSEFANKYIFNNECNARKLTKALSDFKNFKYDKDGHSYVIVTLNIDGEDQEFKVTSANDFNI